MHDYTKRIIFKSNLNSVESYNYMDKDSVINFINHSNVNRQFKIKDTGYEFFIFVDKLSEHTKTLVLNAELYDDNFNEIPLKDGLKLFENENDYRNFIKQCLNKFVTDLNNLNHAIKYFKEFNGAYQVINNKLYAAVYDFKTGKFLEIPEPSELILQFEEVDYGELFKEIMKG